MSGRTCEEAATSSRMVRRRGSAPACTVLAAEELRLLVRDPCCSSPCPVSDGRRRSSLMGLAPDASPPPGPP